MKFVQRSLALVALLLLVKFLGLAYAADEDISYNYRVDDKNQVWVDVENDSDSDIKVTSVVVSFYDKDENIMDKSELPCKSNCIVKVDEAKPFGPITGPKDWETVRVTKVYYEAAK